MLVRRELDGDAGEIRRLTEAAFRPMPFSSGSEPGIIDALRDAGTLTLSLVAVEDDRIVGHIAFSPVTIGGFHEGWFGLGPVSVLPERQRAGIGTALILRGLDLLRERGAKGCALIGSPDYYGRFGFVGDGRLTYGTLEDRLVQHLTFVPPAPRGRLEFAPAFDA